MYGEPHNHSGINREMPEGTLISLPMDVLFKNSGNHIDHGNWIELEDDSGNILSFQQLKEVGDFNPGDTIKASTPIARSGKNGRRETLREEYYSPEGRNITESYWKNYKKPEEEKEVQPQKDNILEWAYKNSMAGLNQFNKGVFSTLDYLLPTERLGKYDFVSGLNNYYSGKSRIGEGMTRKKEYYLSDAEAIKGSKKLAESFEYDEDFPLISVAEMDAVINPLRTFNNFAGSGFDAGRYVAGRLMKTNEKVTNIVRDNYRKSNNKVQKQNNRIERDAGIFNAFDESLLLSADKLFAEAKKRIDGENNAIHFDDVLTEKDKTAGVTVTKLNGKVYKDVSKPLNKALFKAAYEAELRAKTGDIVGNALWFYNIMDHGKAWDIKRKKGWDETIGSTYPGDSQSEVVYNGKVITPEKLGNLTYAYIGAKLGYPIEILLGGSTFAMITGDVKKELENKKLMTLPERAKSIQGEFDDWKTIKQGYDWKWRTK